MARLQILELPEGSGDDRPPFVLVIDEWDIDSLDVSNMLNDYWDAFGQKIGARGVLFVDRTIDIPANDTTTYLQQAAEETGATIGEAVRAVTARHLAEERTDIARDRDRLASHKAALLDALGMDRTRDWDDIGNAAVGLRKQRDEQGEAIERVRRLHQPVEHRGQTICWACSDYDFAGRTTDSAPVAYEQCGTLRALDVQQGQT
ncbi:hypothetical protein ACIRU8_39600 [Streptomyces sp. NPDC101175]|uniref:hypothetical protein n=1 Tax=Streptomyces sp. NPDC101175 TaxID=3366123 RepID=UPI003839119D